MNLSGPPAAAVLPLERDHPMMRPRACVLLLSFLAPAPAWGADFRIELVAQAGKETVAKATYDSADTAPASRAVLMAAVNTPITVRWSVRNLDAAQTAKDVLVHGFVVQEDRPNQVEVPRLTKGVLVESALTMDFRPQDHGTGEITFRVRQAGCYLIRLELKGAAGPGAAEPFAALDLVVR